MFFKKPTPPPAAPNAEERAAIARQQQTAKIRQAMEQDPAYKVMTVDGLGWLCPYTGTIIAAPFGYLDPGLKHLLTTQPWTKTQKKSVEQLQAVRWLHWLRQQLPDEARLQILGADRRWLNPFTGRWQSLQRMHQTLTDDCIKDIAVALSLCPEAGQLKMMPSNQLAGITEKKEESVSHEIDLGLGGTKAVVRRSGSKTESNRILSSNGDEDLRKASAIIHKMLAPMPTIPGYHLLMHYEPQDSVGGDFYECANLGNGRLLLLIGDVTGHGVQGAMVVVAALKSLRHILKQTQDMVEVLAQLADDIKSDLLSGQFITIFAAVLDAPKRTLTCIRAGHHAAVRGSTLRPNVIERVGNSGPAVGLVSGNILRRALRPVTIALEPGDRVVLWTDGLTEAINSESVEFGDFRAMGAVVGTLDLPCEETLSQVVAEARSWCKGNIGDDLTVLVLEVTPEPEET